MTERHAQGQAKRLAMVLDQYANGESDPSGQCWKFPSVASELIELANHFMATLGKEGADT